MSWRHQAECFGHDPGLFHSNLVRDRDAALSICRQCPVTAECLKWGIRMGDDWAVLGATTPEERRGEPKLQGWVKRCKSCRAPFWYARGNRVYCSEACGEKRRRKVSAKPSAQPRPWSETDLARLKALSQAGYGPRAIAAELHRSEDAVKRMRRRRGLVRAGRREGQ